MTLLKAYLLCNFKKKKDPVGPFFLRSFVKFGFANGTGYGYIAFSLWNTEIIFASGAGKISVGFIIPHTVILKLKPLFGGSPQRQKFIVFPAPCAVITGKHTEYGKAEDNVGKHPQNI